MFTPRTEDVWEVAEVWYLGEWMVFPRNSHRLVRPAGARSTWRRKLWPALRAGRLQRIPHSCPLNQQAVRPHAQREVAEPQL
jgi:hypothetical protein